MPPVHWDALLAFTVSPLELFIRGSAVYLLIFVLMRLLRREPGTLGIADLLMVVLIADASQNAMAADYHSVSDGLVLIATIVCWNYTLDWLGAYFPWFERLIHARPAPLIRHGRMLLDSMRRQFVTRNELLAILRERGIEDVAKVRAAYLESDGRVSVILYEEAPQEPPERGPV